MAYSDLELTQSPPSAWSAGWPGRPRSGDRIDELFAWLSSNGMTVRGGSYDASPAADGRGLQALQSGLVLGLQPQRVRRADKKDKERITQASARLAAQLNSRDPRRIWNEIRDPDNALRIISLERLPADAMAFYRPFHFEPYEAWGIYLLVPKLLDYCRTLWSRMAALATFTPETLAACVLFEIFHHEFFHHMVESTAATIEIVSGSMGRPCPVYLEYWHSAYVSIYGEHPHSPLEEALANAYAHNSFDFISRLKNTYLSGLSVLYQYAIRSYWKTESPGYRDAGNYVAGPGTTGYLHGAVQLLTMLMPAHRAGSLPLSIVARSVFPSGHSAFAAKPRIPTWLVGTREEIEELYSLVPRPLETYTSLDWPVDTGSLDKYIKKKRDLERKRKSEEKAGTRSQKPANPQPSLFDCMDDQ